MNRGLLLAIGVIGGAIIGSVVTYGITDPTSRLTNAQMAILYEYLAVYCQREPVPAGAAQSYYAVAGMASRLVSSTGLGPIALAEYARCKVTFPPADTVAAVRKAEFDRAMAEAKRGAIAIGPTTRGVR